MCWHLSERREKCPIDGRNPAQVVDIVGLLRSVFAVVESLIEQPAKRRRKKEAVWMARWMGNAFPPTFAWMFSG